MAFIFKVAGLAMLVVLLTIACGGGSSPASDGATATTAVEATGVPDGQSLSNTYGCTACHSADGGKGVGPTWQGIYGKEESLNDGTTVMVDEAYLRESILDPNAKIVEDFLPGIMPADFGEKLTGSEIDLLIDYIKVLK